MNLANIIKNNGGVTLNIDGTEFKANNGYMVSLKDTEVIVSAGTIDEELKRYFFDLAGKAGDDHKIGYWLDNGRIYIDISVHVGDLDEAMRLAIENDQLAIFDLGNLETIRVK